MQVQAGKSWPTLCVSVHRMQSAVGGPGVLIISVSQSCLRIFDDSNNIGSTLIS